MNKVFTVLFVSSAIALLPACGSRKTVKPVVKSTQKEVVVEVDRRSGPLSSQDVIWNEEDMK